jgi:hypothetical protein
MEKDAGEKILSGTPPLPDFISGYISYKGNGVVKKIIAGDFSARFGQGTNINTGIRRGLSLVSPGYMSASDDIKPYTSTDECRFFRGIATQLSVKNFDLFLFYSKNYSDATLSSSSGISKDYFETFYTGGVHNTALLQNKKDAVSEVAYGITLSCNIKNFKSGFTFSRIALSLPLSISDNDPSRVFDFRDKDSKLFSFYYNLFVKKLLIFGELSANENLNLALVQGFSLRPSDRLAINLLLRSYSPDFTTLYGQGPGTGTKTANQKGVVGNFTYEAAKHLFISAGCELVYYPWLRYRTSAPSSGAKREVIVKFLPGEKISLDASYNYNLSVYDGDNEQGIRKQEQIISRSVKTSIHYSPANNFTIGMRVDYKFVSPSGSKGFSLFQDVNYSFVRIPVTVWFRYCLFDTDDWASRLYAYENDLLYSFSIPALSGKGSRSYLMVKWKIADLTELRIKYGITSVASINSLKESDEIKLQFRVGF